MKKTFTHITTLITILTLLLASCQSQTQTPIPLPSATPMPAPTATAPVVSPTSGPDALQQYLNENPAPTPRVVSSNPAVGQTVVPTAEISLAFDQPMNPDTTAKALRILDSSQAPVTGSISWKNASTLVFKPQSAFQSGSFYQARLDTTATSAAGKPIEQTLELFFETVGSLQVSQVFPANGAKAVESQATITVMFNRPVVPLVIAEEQAKRINPLQFEPEIKGSGEWVNTSLYVFRPEEALIGNQTYKAKIKAGLLDANGDPATALQRDYTWSFSVVAPSVSAVYINNMSLGDGLKNVALNPTIQIRFRQAMDRKSVEANLRLTSSKGSVPLQFTWSEQSPWVDLKPGGLLDLKTDYTLVLDPSARALDGGKLSDGVKRTFTTVLYPAIVSLAPADQAKDTRPEFQINFASPMDFKSLTDRVVFTPAVDVKTHSWYNPDRFIYSFYGLEPSTRYTVKILPGMQDPYGNAIQGERTLTFTTQALAPSAQLMMPSLSMYRVWGPQDFYVQSVNLKSADTYLYSLSTEQFTTFLSKYDARSQYAGAEADLIWHFAGKPVDKPNQRVTEAITMTGKYQDQLPTGFYYLGLKAAPLQSKTPFIDNRLLFVATDNLTIKTSPGQIQVWVTSLKTGKPSEKAAVKILSSTFKVLKEGVTDANGLFQAVIDPDLPDSPQYMSDYRSQWYALVEDEAHFGFASSYWGGGARPANFGITEAYYRPWKSATAYAYTERPLYRPGQPVYFKGIVRSDDDLVYSLPTQQKVEVIVSSYKEQVYQEILPLSEIGTFDSKFILDAEAVLGTYTLTVRWPGEKMSLGSANFDVAEYRRPEFQMQATAQPSNLLPGDAFEVNLAASYYSGGGLAKADVDWTLRSEPFTFTPPPAYSRYSFSDVEYDNWDYYRSRSGGSSSEQIAAGQGQTSPDGKLTIPLKATPPKTAASRRLLFEATVTDFSGNSVSGQAQVVMHKSAVYPGIRSKSYVGTVNQDQLFELVGLDWEGKPLAGAKVDVRIVERKWHYVQQEDDNGQLTWKSSVEETLAASFEAVQLDAKGLGSVTFRPAQGGVYRAIIAARDARGNPAQASAFIWVAGEGYIPWAQSNDRSFQLIADRDSYTPGDTAELLIASPFQGESYAWITVERGHVRKSEVLRLQSNSTLYKLPITVDMAPNVYINVVVVKGVDELNPRPNFKVGMASLKVSIDQQSLKVTLKADRDQAAPREQVRYTVETTTLDGKPVQAEVALALSDLATLSLKESTVPTLLNFFYSPRSLSVLTAVSIIQSIEEYNANLAKQVDVEGKKMGSGGGEKGGGEAGVIPVRQDFPDTAYWQARVKTGPDGKASVTVTLPDNLTIWRMDARAVTTDTRVGQTTLDLMSTQPFLIRPQTPRFFVVGDRLRLGAAIHNNTNQSFTATVKLEAGGLTLESPVVQSVQLAAKGQEYITWEVSVPANSERVDLTFSAEGGGFKDATKPTLTTLPNQGLPVYRFETPETVGTAGVLTQNGARGEAINLPAEMKVQKGQINVSLAASLAAGMTDGLSYLEHYPYECVEQTISRFLPNLRLSQALKAVGRQDPTLEAGLKEQVNLALQRLYSKQNADGGWGWWGGMESDTLITAYVVLGLSDARAAGYKVNEAALKNGLTFLSKHMDTITNQSDNGRANRQAFVLFVLARAGAPEVSRTTQLYDLRQQLSLYARAYLLQALYQINPRDTRIKTIASDLVSAAILSAAGAHWEEEGSDGWNWNTDLRSTAIILDALILADPKNSLNANAVRWLMVNRKAGRWNGTQETAWSLMALTDWVVASGELSPDYRYAVAFNGKELTRGTASPQNNRELQNLTVDVTQMLASESNRLVFARDGSAGSLYYTAYLNLWLPVNQVKAIDRGVTISRQYFRPDNLKQPVTQAKQGELLLVRLTVITPTTQRYLLIDDPLPAGMEAINPSLKSSPKAAAPDSYRWDQVGRDGWGWWYFRHVELRDEKVVLSTDYLPSGTYVYTYLVRASTPGTFNVMPPTAQQFYFPDVYGRGDGSQFVIEP